MPYTRAFVALLLMVQGVLFASWAAADTRQVDGNLWLRSSEQERRAYLVGVANVMEVHEALELRRGETTEDAPMIRMLRAMDASSIEGVMENIDAWYESRPDQLGTPVLGVMWLGLVEATGSQ
jgi:hypothetical protein